MTDSMDRPVKLSARLPKGDANGLDTIYDQVKEHGSAYAVVRFHADKVTVYPNGTREPVLTIERIEGLPALTEAATVAGATFSLAKDAERLLLTARARRLGDAEPDLFDGGVLAEPDSDQED